MESKHLSPGVCEALLNVSSLFGSYEILDKAETYAGNPRSAGAIKRLKEVYRLLTVYGVEQYISFDLAMVSKYHYYTGIIFSAYTYQTGSAIATVLMKREKEKQRYTKFAQENNFSQVIFISE